jgi:hypothetical protein
MRAALSAASTAAAQTTPTRIIKLKHPERTRLLSDPLSSTAQLYRPTHEEGREHSPALG